MFVPTIGAVLLAVIGARWFATDCTGRRLINRRHDWVSRRTRTHTTPTASSPVEAGVTQPT